MTDYTTPFEQALIELICNAHMDGQTGLAPPYSSELADLVRALYMHAVTCRYLACPHDDHVFPNRPEV